MQTRELPIILIKEEDSNWALQRPQRD
uniref:Uncharacterized protein n=1 Tax=Arundo donax TaxID=35708 RepID=A0A0A9AJ84_ARUDO